MLWWEIVLLSIVGLGLIDLVVFSAYCEYRRHQAYMRERTKQTELYQALLSALHKDA